MIRIGVPSKGRLMQDTFDWFGARGVMTVSYTHLTLPTSDLV